MDLLIKSTKPKHTSGHGDQAILSHPPPCCRTGRSPNVTMPPQQTPLTCARFRFRFAEGSKLSLCSAGLEGRMLLDWSLILESALPRTTHTASCLLYNPIACRCWEDAGMSGNTETLRQMLLTRVSFNQGNIDQAGI